MDPCQWQDIKLLGGNYTVHWEGYIACPQMLILRLSSPSNGSQGMGQLTFTQGFSPRPLPILQTGAVGASHQLKPGNALVPCYSTEASSSDVHLTVFGWLQNVAVHSCMYGQRMKINTQRRCFINFPCWYPLSQYKLQWTLNTSLPKFQLLHHSLLQGNQCTECIDFHIWNCSQNVGNEVFISIVSIKRVKLKYSDVMQYFNMAAYARYGTHLRLILSKSWAGNTVIKDP